MQYSDLTEAELELLLTKQLDGMTELSIKNTPINLKGAQALAEVLNTNKTLKSLDLRNNELGPKGVKALTDALKTNVTLTSLDLHNNYLKKEEAKELAEALKTNKTLTSLDLKFNNLGSVGAKMIAEALKTNVTLTSLDLHTNYIKDSGAKALAEALKSNVALTSLNLPCNNLGPEVGKALAEALTSNKTLTSLNLYMNELRYKGGKELAEALKTNKTLTSLNLYANELGDAGAIELAAALKANKTLTSLDLSRNNLGPTGANALVEALKTNVTLTSLYLEYNNLGVEGAEALADALAKNEEIASFAQFVTQFQDESFIKDPKTGVTKLHNIKLKKFEEQLLDAHIERLNPKIVFHHEFIEMIDTIERLNYMEGQEFVAKLLKSGSEEERDLATIKLIDLSHEYSLNIFNDVLIERINGGSDEFLELAASTLVSQFTHDINMPRCNSPLIKMISKEKIIQILKFTAANTELEDLKSTLETFRILNGNAIAEDYSDLDSVATLINDTYDSNLATAIEAGKIVLMGHETFVPQLA